MLSLLVVVVCVGRVIGQGVPCCDRMYRYVEQRGHTMGVILIKDPGGALELSVTIAYKLPWGEQILYDTIQMEEVTSNQTRLLRYYVTFPVKSPLPKITKIKFNNQIVCKTKVPQYEGNAIVMMDHTLKDRQRMMEGSPSVRAPGFSSVLDSRVTTNVPELVVSSMPNLSQEPPIVWPGATPKTQRRPLTTTRTTQQTIQYSSGPFLPSTTKSPPTTSVPLPKAPPVTQGQKKEFCGMSVRPQTLMLGGRDVEKGDWPWMATLHDVKTTVFKCAGALISKRFVVISTHCVIDPITKTTVNEKDLVLIMGKFDFSKWAERDMQPREVRRIILPPGFKEAPLSNDIALLYLEDDVDYTMYARPICLLDDVQDIDSLVNQVGTVVGWDPEEDLPRRALVPIVSRQECRMVTGQDDVNTFCAGNTTVSKHCVGDADSGLFIPKVGADGNLRWYLRGVPSSHLQNNRAMCAQGGYVVYTDAAQFTPWIREVVRTTRPYHD